MVKANLPYYLYRFANILYRWHIPVIPGLVQLGIRIFLSAVIPYRARIGKNVHFGYNGLGIVIHPRCAIGDRVHFYSHVVLGGRGDEGVPAIGNDVVLGSGAKILGGVKIGNGAKIGANAVVISDVPDGATAVGVPARIIEKK